jgi:membrane protease YdiL (CAAX protease family)
MTTTSSVVPGVRRIPVWALIVVILIYLAIIQVTSTLLTADLDLEFASPTSLNELWRSISLGVGLSLVFVYLVVAALRWWRPVFVDDVPTRRWVRWLPVVMLVTIAAGTNWAGLADRGPTFTLALLATTLIVGFAEEGMFRGLAVTTFRVNGFSEGRVALWSTVLFGLAHSINLFTEGPKAALQVMITLVTGYFFYLIRRWAGGLLIPAVLHGLWDFGLITSSVVPDESYAGGVVFVLADVVMLVIVLIHRHRVAPMAEVAPA